MFVVGDSYKGITIASIIGSSLAIFELIVCIGNNLPIILVMSFVCFIVLGISIFYWTGPLSERSINLLTFFSRVFGFGLIFYGTRNLPSLSILIFVLINIKSSNSFYKIYSLCHQFLPILKNCHSNAKPKKSIKIP